MTSNWSLDTIGFWPCNGAFAFICNEACNARLKNLVVDPHKDTSAGPKAWVHATRSKALGVFKDTAWTRTCKVGNCSAVIVNQRPTRWVWVSDEKEIHQSDLEVIMTCTGQNFWFGNLWTSAPGNLMCNYRHASCLKLLTSTVVVSVSHLIQLHVTLMFLNVLQ